MITNTCTLASGGDEVIQMRQVCSQHGSTAKLIEWQTKTIEQCCFKNREAGVVSSLLRDENGLHASTSLGRL